MKVVRIVHEQRHCILVYYIYSKLNLKEGGRRKEGAVAFSKRDAESIPEKLLEQGLPTAGQPGPDHTSPSYHRAHSNSTSDF